MLQDAIVAVIRRADGRFLFARRAKGETYSGYWNPVTGGCESALDDHLFATAVREVREEIGLEVRVIGKMWESTTVGSGFLLHWLLAKPVGDQTLVLDDREVDEARWLTLADARTIDPTFADSRAFFREVFERVSARLHSAWEVA